MMAFERPPRDAVLLRGPKRSSRPVQQQMKLFFCLFRMLLFHLNFCQVRNGLHYSRSFSLKALNFAERLARQLLEILFPWGPVQPISNSFTPCNENLSRVPLGRVKNPRRNGCEHP